MDKKTGNLIKAGVGAGAIALQFTPVGWMADVGTAGAIAIDAGVGVAATMGQHAINKNIDASVKKSEKHESKKQDSKASSATSDSASASSAGNSSAAESAASASDSARAKESTADKKAASVKSTSHTGALKTAGETALAGAFLSAVFPGFNKISSLLGTSNKSGRSTGSTLTKLFSDADTLGKSSEKTMAKTISGTAKKAASADKEVSI